VQRKPSHRPSSERRERGGEGGIECSSFACGVGLTEQETNKAGLANTRTFNSVMRFCLSNTPAIFDMHLGRKPSAAAADGAGAEEGEDKRNVKNYAGWDSISALVRSFLGNSMHFLGTTMEPKMLRSRLRLHPPSVVLLLLLPRRPLHPSDSLSFSSFGMCFGFVTTSFVLKSMEAAIPYFEPYPKLSSKFCKVCATAERFKPCAASDFCDGCDGCGCVMGLGVASVVGQRRVSDTH
jgi:hypothetical protein